MTKKEILAYWAIVFIGIILLEINFFYHHSNYPMVAGVIIAVCVLSFAAILFFVSMVQGGHWK